MPTPIAPAALTPAGLSPDRADRATFVARSIARDDFIKNMQIPELQASITNVYNNSLEAFNSGVSASANAASSATNASQAAAASAATQWVSGTNYVVGDARWSPITKISYRRLIAGAGTTDPSADATNWGTIVLPVAAGGTGAITASAARTGLGATAVGDAVFIAATAAAARTALDLRQLQSVDFTLVSNTLILKLNPTNRDYRSTSLLSGVAVNVSNATQLTLTISNGSTLGLVSGVQSEIAIISINNAGTMELAAINVAGGVSLSEEGIINTVAEGAAGAADSATVFYSNTARTGVAYRLEGIFRSTQTTAGTWAQPPTLVQAVGGQAIAAMASLGYGQTEINFSSSGRVSGTTYYNGSKPMWLSVTGVNTAATSFQIDLATNGVTVQSSWPFNTAAAGNILSSVSYLIRPYASYSVTLTACSINKWFETK